MIKTNYHVLIAASFTVSLCIIIISVSCGTKKLPAQAPSQAWAGSQDDSGTVETNAPGRKRSSEIRFAQDIAHFDSIVFHGTYDTAGYEITTEKIRIKELPRLGYYWNVIDTSSPGSFFGPSVDRNDLLHRYFERSSADTTIYIVVFEGRSLSEKVLVGVIRVKPGEGDFVKIPWWELKGTLKRIEEGEGKGILEYHVYVFRADSYLAKDILVL